MSSGQHCRVHFHVQAPTLIGQTIAVGGDCFSLGGFDVNKVIPLVTTPESYPVWYTQKPVILPRGQLVHYKYCILEAGTVKAFENFEGIY